MTQNNKNSTKSKIIRYMLNHKITSKTELAKELELSMPTVLTNVNELISKGIVAEIGEYQSTGGRKAKSIGINKGYARAIGIVISANHLEMALVNLGYEIEKLKRIRLPFSADFSYCTEVAAQADIFIDECSCSENLLGIGIAIPGIIDHASHILTKSHALNTENLSLHLFEQAFSYPLYFENDANAAMLAENQQLYPDALYLSLNNTLGGAFCIDGKLIHGKNSKAGEFGHMILVPNGRKCYCQKKGCADAYCASNVLTNDNEISLDDFMRLVQTGDKDAVSKWENYLDYLAILISNLRMAYDLDIILGGDVGGVLSDYMIPLSQRVMSCNKFDHDTSYLKLCSYAQEASAVGVAKHFLMEL